MTDFKDTKGWILNGDVIERPDPSGRTLLLRGRKNIFFGNLIELRATAAVAWDDGGPSVVFDDQYGEFLDVPGSEKRAAGHVFTPSITGKVELSQCCIHAFSLNNETIVRRLQTIGEFRVIPIDPEDRKKRQEASNPLAVGGSLFLWRDTEGGSSTLAFEGYLDQDAFMNLFDRIISRSDAIAEVLVSFSASLFRDEVEAAFQGYSDTRNLGFLVGNEGSGRTPARIESISVRFNTGEVQRSSSARSGKGSWFRS